MARKKRCGNCKNYFAIEIFERNNKFCSKKCSEESRQKKYLRAKENLKKREAKKVVKKSVGRKTKTERQKAKENAWDVFSVYIRRRDCIRFTGNPDEGVCVTCKKPFPFKKLQAGHFIPGRGNAVLFDERLVYTQCFGCNVSKGGNYIEYFVFMEQEWGRSMIDDFRQLRYKIVKYKIDDFIKIKDTFKEKTRKLLEETEAKNGL